MFIPFLAFHTPTKAYIAEDYGPRHLTTLDGTKGGGTTGTKVERIARQVGPLVDHARSNIKSNDVHGVTIVCLVDIFDKIPRSRLNDESSRMVAHFRTTWYRKVEECSAVSRLGLISAAIKGLNEAFSVECRVDLMVVKITYSRAVTTECNVALIKDGPGCPASKHAKRIIWKPFSPPRPHAKEHKHKEQRLSRTRVDYILMGKRWIGIKHYCFGSWQVLGQVRQFFIFKVVVI
mmetsp:Transcript_4653/g.13281  ORF Transcript_4653/g.13281 Transcript_4653/m.13281 type:complete len:234 (-) Transcript_4653:1351-2052(-)